MNLRDDYIIRIIQRFFEDISRVLGTGASTDIQQEEMNKLLENALSEDITPYLEKKAEEFNQLIECKTIEELNILYLYFSKLPYLAIENRKRNLEKSIFLLNLINKKDDTYSLERESLLQSHLKELDKG